jgi:hypothetical protein
MPDLLHKNCQLALSGILTTLRRLFALFWLEMSQIEMFQQTIWQWPLDSRSCQAVGATVLPLERCMVPSKKKREPPATYTK